MKRLQNKQTTAANVTDVIDVFNYIKTQYVLYITNTSSCLLHNW